MRLHVEDLADADPIPIAAGGDDLADFDARDRQPAGEVLRVDVYVNIFS
jgi:hypothetical protein